MCSNIANGNEAIDDDDRRSERVSGGHDHPLFGYLSTHWSAEHNPIGLIRKRNGGFSKAC